MNKLKAMIVVGLLLAVGNGAWALTLKDLPEEHPDDLEYKFKFQDWSSGHVYLPTTRWLSANTIGDDLVLTGTKLDAVKAGTDLDAFVAFPVVKPMIAGETSWGLFRLQEIQGWDGVAYTKDLYDIDDDAGDVPPGDADDVLGMFGGLVDKHVTLTMQDDGGTPLDVSDDRYGFDLWADGDSAFVKLYEMPDASMVLGGPGDRIGATSYPTFTGANEMLDMVPLADEISGAPIAGMKFFSTATVDGSAGIVNDVLSPGQARMVLDIVGGTDASSNGGYFNDAVDRDGDPATEDIIFLTNVFGDTTGHGWTTNTDDPAFGGVFIPEPLTAVGVLFAVSGLAGYVRKRRA